MGVGGVEAGCGQDAMVIALLVLVGSIGRANQRAVVDGAVAGGHGGILADHLASVVDGGPERGGLLLEGLIERVLVEVV